MLPQDILAALDRQAFCLDQHLPVKMMELDVPKPRAVVLDQLHGNVIWEFQRDADSNHTVCRRLPRIQSVVEGFSVDSKRKGQAFLRHPFPLHDFIDRVVAITVQTETKRSDY